MADPLSLVSGIIVLTKVVGIGIKSMKTIYRTSKDVHRLKLELEGFSRLVDAIRKHIRHKQPLGYKFNSLLIEAAAIIQSVHILVRELCKRDSDDGRLHPLTSMVSRKNSKLRFLSGRLRNTRENLQETLRVSYLESMTRNDKNITDIIENPVAMKRLFTETIEEIEDVEEHLPNCFRSSNEIESKLEKLTEALKETNSVSNRVQDEVLKLSMAFQAFCDGNHNDRQQSSHYLQLVLNSPQDAIHRFKDSQTPGTPPININPKFRNKNEDSLSGGWANAWDEEDEKAIAELQLLYYTRNGSEEEWDALNTGAAFNSNSNFYDDESAVIVQYLSESPSIRPNPWFESSSSFFPEQYSLTPLFPTRYKVISVTACEPTGYVRAGSMVKYHLVYAETPRKWVAVTVTVLNSHNLGTILLELLEDCLATTKFGNTVTNIGFPTTTDGYPTPYDYAAAVTLTEDIIETEPYRHVDHILGVDDLGCAQYLDSEVITESEHNHGGTTNWSLDQGFSLIHRVLVEGTQYVARRVPFRPGMESFWYELYCLHYLQGSSSVINFHGVVLEDNRRVIKAFLVEPEVYGTVEDILSITKSIRLPLVIIESWAYQIVRGVAEVHAKSLTLGKLSACNVGIFKNWRVKLSNFSRQPLANENGKLAPELRRKLHPGKSLLNAEEITREGDIFQLGLLLWTLIEHIPGQHSILSKEYCKRADCPSLNPANQIKHCTAEHCNPVTLLPCTRHIPGYLQAIIESCRSADPRDRLPAYQLLGLFPRRITLLKESRVSDALAALELPSNVAPTMAGKFVRCDRCGTGPVTIHYHCSECDQGDFDVCEACVQTGIRCYDDSHWMFKRELKDKRIIWRLGENLAPSIIVKVVGGL